MRILSVEFNNDKIFGNLFLDLSDPKGNSLDTIILAGENGCGKTSILEALYDFSEMRLVQNDQHCDRYITVTYQISEKQLDFIATNLEGVAAKIKYAIDGKVSIKKDYSISIYNYSQYIISFKYLTEQGEQQFSSSILQIFRNNEVVSLFKVAFSTVEINYNPQKIATVTSKEIDAEISTSARSGGNLATEIKQLFIDIQNNDATELSLWVHEHPGEVPPENVIDRRIKRFNNAFAYIFGNLKFKTILTQNGEKQVIFQKNGTDIPIESLSSGEKQIVFRGAFLLKDLESTKGRIVLIDEPEISLHPNWQIKILDFYKNLFIDEEKNQTSQIVVATHSPFVVHNKNRRNDKVVVLQRNTDGNVIIENDPEYYDCNSTKAIQDAFQDSVFWERVEKDKQIVYLEGRTDEKYLNKALEVFGYNNLNFQFKWVGYLDESGNEVNTGKDNLGKAFHFLISLNRSVKTICLFDCDTSRQETEKNNVCSYAINTYKNTTMKKGIENALKLEKIDLSPYYSCKKKIGDYGEEKSIGEFDKMACCEAICAMDNETLKDVFSNLRIEIDKIISKFAQ